MSRRASASSEIGRLNGAFECSARCSDERKATTGGFQSAQGYDGAGGAGCRRLDGDQPAELLCQVAMTFCPSA